MRPFEILSPTTLDDTRRELSRRDGEAAILAGGTDVLGEIKEGTASPNALINITGVEGLGGIEFSENGVIIGSLVTLAQIEGDENIRAHYPALSQAAESVATPQIRNVGTLGGNLCQRPRCWYYRSPLFDCLKKGGDTCFAVDGLNKYHAIFGGDGCHIVHPSDTAVALTALDASVEIYGAQGLRQAHISEFFVGPQMNMLSETALDSGEIVTRVLLPALVKDGDDSRSIYLKAKERQAYDFALVSVAGSVVVQDGVISSARFALGGVAPTPYPLPDVAGAIVGSRIADVNAPELGRVAVRDAKPMTDNAYKVRLASNLVSRAVATLLAPYQSTG